MLWPILIVTRDKKQKYQQLQYRAVPKNVK